MLVRQMQKKYTKELKFFINYWESVEEKSLEDLFE